MNRLFTFSLIAVLLHCLLPESALAQAGDASAGAVAPLMSRPLTGVPGKEAIMLTVDYAPGGASPAHRHNADVFVYVLEGSVIMQVDGADPVTIPAGGIFHENPDDVHRQSRNASDTDPAKILVMMVKEQDAPPTLPPNAAPAEGKTP